MANIQDKFGVTIPFPIIEDIKMEGAGAYGMVHPGAADTQAVRATFFIDPNGILRAMVYYPCSITNGCFQCSGVPHEVPFPFSSTVSNEHEGGSRPSRA